ncbi:MAG TPA: rhomboid family intramembrane serine protease [Reyranellaceae bacterium]|nr:rhomboid family intramembrane serine protease [Reyranellaceae bacterium]
MPFDDAGRPGPWRGAGERAINLPPTVLLLIGINVAVHVLRALLSEAFDQRIVLQLGLVAAAYTGDAGPTGVDPVALFVAPFTYQFLHASWLHLGVNMLTLAAFGAPVERVLGWRRFITFYILSGIVAGFVHVLFFYDALDPVVGASGAISGLFGAVLILMRRLGRLPSLIPIALIWIGLNVFFGIVGGTPGAGGDPVAWTAHIGGFVFGLAAIRLFVPRPSIS